MESKTMGFQNVLEINLQLEKAKKDGNVDRAIESTISMMTNGLSDAWESDKTNRAIEIVKDKFQVLLEEWS